VKVIEKQKIKVNFILKACYIIAIPSVIELFCIFLYLVLAASGFNRILSLYNLCLEQMDFRMVGVSQGLHGLHTGAEEDVTTK